MVERGGAYAAHASWLLGVEDLVFGCFGKAGVTPVSVDFVVDDQPSMPERYGGYAVAAFEGKGRSGTLGHTRSGRGARSGETCTTNLSASSSPDSGATNEKGRGVNPGWIQPVGATR